MAPRPGGFPAAAAAANSKSAAAAAANSKSAAAAPRAAAAARPTRRRAAMQEEKGKEEGALAGELAQKPLEDVPAVPLPLAQIFLRGGPAAVPNLFMEWAGEYGDVFSWQLPGREQATLFVTDPSDFDEVFANESDAPVTVGPALGHMKQYHLMTKGDAAAGQVALVEGEEWRRVRGALQDGMLRPSRAGAFAPAVAPAARALSRRLAEDPTPDPARVKDLLQRTTLTAIKAIMLGRCDVGLLDGTASEESEAFLAATNTIGQLGAGFMNGGFLWRTFPALSPAWQKYVDAQRTAERIETAWVQEVVDELAELERAMGGGGNRHAQMGRWTLDEASDWDEAMEQLSQSYLARLLASRAEAGAAELSIDEIVNNVGGFVQGGVDTTSGLLLWLLVNLARNPDKQEILREELQRVLQGEDADTRVAMGRSYTPKPGEAGDVPTCPYLEAVLRETYRLTPPALGVPRRAEADLTLGGYSVPKGTPLLLFTMKALRDDALFDNAMEFRPERWLGSNDLSAKARKVVSITPFGRGKRMCIGSNVAQVEARVILARLLQDFKISLVDPSAAAEIGMTLETIVIPNPLPAFRFERL